MPEIGLSAAVVTIGDEVVEGRIANANAVWITERLMEWGIWPRLVVAVPDDQALIVRQLRIAADAADITVVSGGLGWTPDDVTRRSVAEAFYRETEVDEELAAAIEAEHGWATAAISRMAASFPQGATPLPSPIGGVPGFRLRDVYVLPGAPAEMRAMLDSIDFDRQHGSIHREALVWSVTEDRIDELLRAFEREHVDVRIGSYPDFSTEPPVVTLTLTSRNGPAVQEALTWIRVRLGELT
jgi:molybdenum cofactor synthesis domain-containing protein